LPSQISSIDLVPAEMQPNGGEAERMGYYDRDQKYALVVRS
jgi:hypothetical protein